jgi:hypothetical protein
MRFQRHVRHVYEPTDRKGAAILRRQRKERDALPLFAAEIASGQLTVAEEHRLRTLAWEKSQREWRARLAREWRQARAELVTFPPAEREQLLRHWNRHRWLPGTPGYLLNMLHRHRTGRLDMSLPGMTTAPAARLEA